MPRTYGKKKQQTRLTFAPVVETSSPPGDEAGAQSSPLKPAKLRYSHPSSSSSPHPPSSAMTKDKRKVVVRGQLQLRDYGAASQPQSRGDARRSDEGTATTSKSKSKSKLEKQTQPSSLTSPQIIQGESSSEGDIIQPSAKRRPFIVAESDDSESNTDTQPSPHHQRNQNSKTTESPYSKRDSSSSSSSKKSDDTDESEYSAPKTRSVLSAKRRVPSSDGESPPRKKSLRVDLTELAESETSGAEALVTAPSSSRKRKTTTPKKTHDSFVVEDDDSESDIVPANRKRSTPKSVQKPEDDDVDNSSDDVVALTPARRRLKKAPHTPRQSSDLRQDELDIQEDLEDLTDTAVKQSRTRGAPVNSARSKRQKHLELLRRRRAGEKDPEPATDEEEKSDEENEDEDPEENNILASVRFPRINIYDYHKDSEDDSDVESNVHADEDLDQDDASFVDADETDDHLGVPTSAASLPFEFSRHRTKQPRECFRDVVEWMVHNKLNPAFERHDEIYQFAFRKLDDEVVGRSSSQLISSVWNADFRNALRARPYIDVTSFPTSEFYNCAACNRTKHPASSDIRLFGQPYSEETLEPLYESDEDDDDDDDDDDDGEDKSQHSHERKQDRDRDGNILPPETRHFYLGKHCKANAVLTHTLLHWRFNLYEWVVDYLDAKEGLSDPQRSVEREKLSRKKRAKYANRVVDAMDRDGEIQRLWRDFHHTLKAAREKTG